MKKLVNVVELSDGEMAVVLDKEGGVLRTITGEAPAKKHYLKAITGEHLASFVDANDGRDVTVVNFRQIHLNEMRAIGVPTSDGLDLDVTVSCNYRITNAVDFLVNSKGKALLPGADGMLLEKAVVQAITDRLASKTVRDLIADRRVLDDEELRVAANKLSDKKRLGVHVEEWKLVRISGRGARREKVNALLKEQFGACLPSVNETVV